MEPNWWLVVWNRETGDLQNVDVYDESDDFTEVVNHFKQKCPNYDVTDGGKGIVNRPKAIKNLPYIS